MVSMRGLCGPSPNPTKVKEWILLLRWPLPGQQAGPRTLFPPGAGADPRCPTPPGWPVRRDEKRGCRWRPTATILVPSRNQPRGAKAPDPTIPCHRRRPPGLVEPYDRNRPTEAVAANRTAGAAGGCDSSGAIQGPERSPGALPGPAPSPQREAWTQARDRRRPLEAKPPESRAAIP